ncbi:MAG: phosphotransferase [Proteobacteria bacterium]|jgi:aminoglycoside/choline kinase family phosphotransferase|nr:phosphotransferase [Pseudomonadota bacterium]
MASITKPNLSKVKKQLLNKNIKTGGTLKFNPDASNKIFQLCKTGKKTFLLLSFQNNPVEYQRYLKADSALSSQQVLTPSIIEKNSTHKYLLMEYFPTNNASRYYKKEELKDIFPQAIKTLKHLQHPRKRFSGIPIKPFNNLSHNASKGIETYIEYFDYKIQIGYYLNRLIQKSLKNNLIALNKYKPTLTHGDFFLENFIYYQKNLYLIDHQDLHYNHPYLDIASLIFDARRLYSSSTEDKLIRSYAKKFNLSLNDFRSDIHLVSLARNLRILGNWVNLYRSGKTQYLKKYRKNTWLQILKHVEHLRLWDLRELFEEIYNKTK